MACKLCQRSSSSTVRGGITETASLFCTAFLMVALIICLSSVDRDDTYDAGAIKGGGTGSGSHRHLLSNRPCDEIYVVGEGETLHTISDKCGDPFIVDQNPHIHDPDDVFPGLVIKITPFKPI